MTSAVSSYEDIKKLEISNRTAIISLIIGVGVAVYNNNLFDAYKGAIIMAAPLYVIAYIYLAITNEQGLGGGDIKIAFIYGLYLKEAELIYAAYFITFFLAGIFLLIRKAIRSKSENSGIPLIPFMSLGTTVAYVMINIR